MDWTDTDLKAIKKIHIQELRQAIDILQEALIEDKTRAILNVAKSTIKLGSDTNTANINIANFDKSKHSLMVFQNSVYISEETDYTIDSNSVSITLNNDTWDAGTELNFVAFITDEEEKIQKSITTTTVSTNLVAINNSNFKVGKDSLLAFKNSTLLTEGIDYNITSDGLYIQKTVDTWDEPSTFQFILFKQ